MGTQGVFGFKINNELKVNYVQYDAYPADLGVAVANAVAGTTVDKLRTVAQNIVVVSDKLRPTPRQIIECEPFTDLTVSTGSPNEWYCLIRNAQNDPRAYTSGRLRYMQGSGDDVACVDYGYVVNLDDETLDFYIGRQLAAAIPLDDFSSSQALEVMNCVDSY